MYAQAKSCGFVLFNPAPRKGCSAPISPTRWGSTAKGREGRPAQAGERRRRSVFRAPRGPSVAPQHLPIKMGRMREAPFLRGLLRRLRRRTTHLLSARRLGRYGLMHIGQRLGWFRRRTCAREDQARWRDSRRLRYAGAGRCERGRGGHPRL